VRERERQKVKTHALKKGDSGLALANQPASYIYNMITFFFLQNSCIFLYLLCSIPNTI